jgi:NAD(P)-dependent dehydrogenase (short-subunit alcohol dehydrogenase family)
MPQTIIITGASDGIGATAARQLSAAGEHVVIVGRSPERTAAIANELGAPHHLVDYSDLDQVRVLADELLAAYPRIDVLANNAGGIMPDHHLTKDGFEQTLQVNHLGGYLLTRRLLPRLIESRAKVIQTSSMVAKTFGRIDLADLQNSRKYTANKAYGDAKLANILFTRELHRRHHSDGISTAAFHPGVVATSFGSDSHGVVKFLYYNPLMRRFLVKPEDGGARLTWLASGTPGTTWQSGEYYEKNRTNKSSDQANDATLATELWDASEKLVAPWL